MHAQFLNCKGAQFTALDIGAPDTNYHFMRHFFENANAMIFCVDSSDRDRMPKARTELQKMLPYYDERTVPVLVFANKQDSSYALPIDEFIREMGLEEIKNQPWRVSVPLFHFSPVLRLLTLSYCAQLIFIRCSTFSFH
jgi:ADP-ribosylation factor 1/2